MFPLIPNAHFASLSGTKIASGGEAVRTVTDAVVSFTTILSQNSEEPASQGQTASDTVILAETEETVPLDQQVDEIDQDEPTTISLEVGLIPQDAQLRSELPHALFESSQMSVPDKGLLMEQASQLTDLANFSVALPSAQSFLSAADDPEQVTTLVNQIHPRLERSGKLSVIAKSLPVTPPEPLPSDRKPGNPLLPLEKAIAATNNPFLSDDVPANSPSRPSSPDPRPAENSPGPPSTPTLPDWLRPPAAPATTQSIPPDATMARSSMQPMEVVKAPQLMAVADVPKTPVERTSQEKNKPTQSAVGPLKQQSATITDRHGSVPLIAAPPDKTDLFLNTKAVEPVDGMSRFEGGPAFGDRFAPIGIVPNAQTAVPAHSHGAPDQARQIAQQLAASTPPQAPGTTEITLNPEELGRVRMNLSLLDGTLTLTIQAERTDTADLMRRHIDQLAQTYRQLGFTNMSFSFTGSESQSDKNHSAQTPTGETIADDIAVSAEPVATSLRAVSGRLDLRI